MLIAPDGSELGDKRLNEEESLSKLKEKNLQLASKFKIPDQATLENTEMAQGHPMPYQDLIFLLKKMCPTLVIEDGGMANAVAVRIPGMLEDGTFGKRYVTGFYKEVLPEFSSVSTDTKGLPVREHRGWRTVVLACIKQGVVSYKDAVYLFGEPNGVRGGRWHDILRDKK
jgi:hypothetical protein